MLKDLFPQKHSRFSALPLLGSHVEGFVAWLHACGYPAHRIRVRVRMVPRVERSLEQLGVRRIEDLSAADILALAPRDSRDDAYLAAAARSLSTYFESIGLLRRPVATPLERLVGEYGSHLDRVRGLAKSNRAQHAATASEFLKFAGFDGDSGCLRALSGRDIEAFLRSVGPRFSRVSLQHVVGHLRSFLRFLAMRGQCAAGLDAAIDTPRIYRGERLPRSLPWDTVRGFLRAIDRSSPMGKRDYAIFLLVATYGLRTCEVAALRLDDVEWRSRRLKVPRPKAGSPLVLPLTDDVGAALVDYLRNARPDLPHREVFLRVRAPAGSLRPGTVTAAFNSWARRSGLRIPFHGPHCLRHSLAVHLLRQRTPLKVIGDLLGHRGAESTCVYLRLNVEDLRDAALDLPREVRP